MPLWIVCAFLLQSASTSPTQSASPSVTGAWVLNPALTKRPDEIGFDAAWARAGARNGDTETAGRGRRGGSRSGGTAEAAPQLSAESADDSTRVQQLTAEARTPPAHLTIVQDASKVSIADDQGLARTFHPTGKQEDLTIGTVPLPTTAQWDAGSLVIVYDVESGRQLRYTYTPLPNPKRLLVDIRFIDRGREGDEVQLTYEPPDAHNETLVAGAPASPSAAMPRTAVNGSTGGPVGAPPTPPAALPPGSELRGISTIAIDVEDLSGQAAACGLDQSRIKNTISKILADAGFKLPTYSNVDANVVVNIGTSKLADGACVSRYDVSLVSDADATFPYLKGTVAAVEVQLLHEGGMAGGPPAAHASSVMDALTKSVNHFVEQIRAAAK